MDKFVQKLDFLKSLDVYIGGGSSRFKVIGDKLYYVSSRVHVYMQDKKFDSFDGLSGKISDVADIMSNCKAVSRKEDVVIFKVGAIKIEYVNVDMNPVVYDESAKLFDVKGKAISSLKTSHFTNDVVTDVIEALKKENESFIYLSSLFITEDSIKVTSPTLYLAYGNKKSTKQFVKIPLYVYKVAKLLNEHEFEDSGLFVYDNFVQLKGNDINIICSIETGMYENVVIENVEQAIYGQKYYYFLDGNGFENIYDVMSEMINYVGELFTIEGVDNVNVLKLTGYGANNSIKAEKSIKLENKIDLKHMLQVNFNKFNLAKAINVSKVELSSDNSLVRFSGKSGELIAVI